MPTIEEAIKKRKQDIVDTVYFRLDFLLTESVGLIPCNKNVGMHYSDKQIKQAFELSGAEITKLLLEKAIEKYADFSKYYEISLNLGDPWSDIRIKSHQS